MTDPYMVVHLKNGEQLRLQLPGLSEQMDESARVDYFNKGVTQFRKAGAMMAPPTEDWTVAKSICVSWDSVSYVEAVW